MASPTLPQILDVETEVETLLVNYLGTGLGLPAGPSDTDQTLSTPRLEVKVSLISEGMHQITVAAGASAGLTFYDQKQVVIDLDLVFSVSKVQNQGTLRGTLRQLTGNWEALKAAFAINNFYRLAPDTLRQVNGGRTVDALHSTETISTRLQAVLFLNTDVFP